MVLQLAFKDTPSIGSDGNAYNNAAAETVMGLFKNEAVAKDSPFRAGALKTESDVVEVVFEWVHWYNTERLHSSLGHHAPEEFERTSYDEKFGSLPDAAAHKTVRRHDSRDGSPCSPCCCNTTSDDGARPYRQVVKKMRQPHNTL